VYRLTLTVVPILDVFEVRAVLRADNEDGTWTTEAVSSQTLALPRGFTTEDDFVNIIHAVRQWSFLAISE